MQSAALRSVLVPLLLQPQARAPHTGAPGADLGQSTSRHWGGAGCMERAEQASEEGTSDFWGYSSTGYAPRADQVSA